ncbi:hypothetical protein [Salinisphaera orenii]|uniref:hypothetical protein n=1 Tax=Salinisphaera orenii TaxID=856731 RepID=UPI000DBE650D
MTSTRKQNTQRTEMAQVAARIMIDSGIRDFRCAKQKAAEHLGINPRNSILPKNREIEAATIEHQRLFGGNEHTAELQRMRQTARQAMRLFADFRPRLVGEVFSGTASPDTPICLHLFAEQPEAMDMFLDDQAIPFEIVERRFKFGGGQVAFYPTFCFVAGDDCIEATVFEHTGLRQPPLSLVNGGAMPRATPADLDELLASSTTL